MSIHTCTPVTLATLWATSGMHCYIQPSHTHRFHQQHSLWRISQSGLSFAGFAVTGFFASRLLAKLGVKADVLAVGKYKNCVTPMLDVKFNKANKEATMGYLTSWKDQLVEDIAADRGLSPQEVNLVCTYCHLLWRSTQCVIKVFHIKAVQHSIQ